MTSNPSAERPPGPPPPDWSNEPGPLRVALVADTHGVVDPRILELVASADACVHAGDVGALSVLRALAPRRGVVLAVRGNNDVPSKWPPGEETLAACLPPSTRLALPGGLLVVEHGHRAGPLKERHGRLRRRYPEARAVLYGHSHRLVCDRTESPWILNPGAAGRARTYGGPSCLILTAEAGGWEVVEHRFAHRLHSG